MKLEQWLSKRSLYGKIVAETTQKISQAGFGAKRAIARLEIEKTNDSLGLRLPSEGPYYTETLSIEQRQPDAVTHAGQGAN